MVREDMESDETEFSLISQLLRRLQEKAAKAFTIGRVLVGRSEIAANSSVWYRSKTYVKGWLPGLSEETTVRSIASTYPCIASKSWSLMRSSWWVYVYPVSSVLYF